MYEILLYTWYQETPEITHEEVYNNLKFTDFSRACIFLGKNIDTILDEYPVVYLSVKFNKSLNQQT